MQLELDFKILSKKNQQSVMIGMFIKQMLSQSHTLKHKTSFSYI